MKMKRAKVIAQALAASSGLTLQTRPVCRKRIGIRELLTWAFCEELPKDRETGLARERAALSVGAGGWAAMNQQAGLMVEILHSSSVDPNVWGVVPDFSAQSDPHPDALRVGAAVRALDALVMTIPAGWEADADLRRDVDGLDDLEWTAAANRALGRIACPSADGENQLRGRLSDIIVHAATTGKPPRWQADVIKRRVVMQANGRPAWFVRAVVETGTDADGMPRFSEVERMGTGANGRPLPGAYQKTLLEPDPADMLARRAEYELWHAALAFLAEELAGLGTWAVLGCKLPARPWLAAGDSQAQRILPDLRLRFLAEKGRSGVAVGRGQGQRSRAAGFI